MRKLGADELIAGNWEGSDGTRRRRQYELTTKGREHLIALRRALREYFGTLTEIIGGVQA